MKKIRTALANLFGGISRNHGVALLVSLIGLTLLCGTVMLLLYGAERLNTWLWAWIDTITTRDMICVGIGIAICVVLDFVRAFRSKQSANDE